MNHNDIRHKLSDYIDGAVSHKEKAEIELHLKTCTRCNTAFSELRKTVQHIKNVEEVESPAWMTQKIMAKVRTEAGEKKSIFHRLFFPLPVKVPLGTVAVLFLAVTAYYIYQGINPAAKYTEAPVEVAAKKDALSTDQIAREEKAIQAPRAKKIEQEPGYKSLDMKYEYEKPAPPVPLGEAAPAPPAPAKPAEQPALEKRAPAPGIAAPTMRDMEAGAAPRAEAKLKSAAPARQALSAISADKAGPVIIVRVKDLDAAAKEVERAIFQVGGVVTGKEHPEAKKVYRAAIYAQRLPELRNKLKLIGEVKDETAALESQDSRVEFKIELVMNSAQQ